MRVVVELKATRPKTVPKKRNPVENVITAARLGES